MGWKEDLEKKRHDKKADELNATTYRKPAEPAMVNPKDKDAPGLASVLKKRKKPPTAGDAAEALARRKKEY